MSLFFFFNDTATTEIYTLSLHDALPISLPDRRGASRAADGRGSWIPRPLRSETETVRASRRCGIRSEEHTSELQSRSDLVCRLLLEKKKQSDSASARRRPRP